MKTMNVRLEKDDIGALIEEQLPVVVETVRGAKAEKYEFCKFDVTQICYEQVCEWLNTVGATEYDWKTHTLFVPYIQGEEGCTYKLSQRRDSRYKMARVLELQPTTDGIPLEHCNFLVFDYIRSLVNTFLTYFLLSQSK